MSKQLSLVLPDDYIVEATKAIKNAKQRVYFMTLTIIEDEVTDDFIDALGLAARRGIDVVVAADMFTYGELGGHFLPLKFFTKKSRNTTAMVRKLKANGVRFDWLGRFSATPFTGRTHIKALVIDDTVYSFGGVNLYGKDLLNNIDYMFRCTDARLADDIVHECSQITKADHNHYAYRSHKFSFGDDTVLFDGGFQGDSIIYRRACELAREAKEVILVSQYCPTGKLGRILRNKKTKLYFNRAELAGPLNKMVITTGLLFSGHRSLYTKNKYLHAKFMIFTMPDGKKVAITGSHNFVYAGVLLGTREIALETKNPKIINQLERFLKKHVV